MLENDEDVDIVLFNDETLEVEIVDVEFVEVESGDLNIGDPLVFYNLGKI